MKSNPVIAGRTYCVKRRLGTDPMWKWLLLVMVLLVAAAQGCKKEITVLPPPPVPEKTAPEPAPDPVIPIPPVKPPVVETKPPVKTVPLPTKLDDGERLFREGNYKDARSKIEAYINENSKSELTDRALFFLGMSRAFADKTDTSGAKRALQKIVSDYPRSEYRNPAELILSLLKQVDKLQTDLEERDAKINRLQEELNRLKEIDMNRRPSRPTEQ